MLLTAYATGSDARLDRLVARYSHDVVSASSKLAPAASSTTLKPASTATKRPITITKKASRASFARSDELRAVQDGSERLVGYARISMDEQTTGLQLNALRGAGCTVIHEDARGRRSSTARAPRS